MMLRQCETWAKNFPFDVSQCFVNQPASSARWHLLMAFNEIRMLIFTACLRSRLSLCLFSCASLSCRLDGDSIVFTSFCQLAVAVCFELLPFVSSLLQFRGLCCGAHLRNLCLFVFCLCNMLRTVSHVILCLCHFAIAISSQTLCSLLERPTLPTLSL
jgi:hypothetical protein